jgi:hypothetical protein
VADVSDYELPDMTAIEDELMNDETFSLGWRCGMLHQCVTEMAAGFFDDTSVFAVRQLLPTKCAGIVFRISELTGIHCHTHELDETLMSVCFIRGIPRDERGNESTQ